MPVNIGAWLWRVDWRSFCRLLSCLSQQRRQMRTIAPAATAMVSCLNVDGRRFLARCEMKLNVSSWTKVDDGCPVSELEIRQSRPVL
jgi:hypothetical protein